MPSLPDDIDIPRVPKEVPLVAVTPIRYPQIAEGILRAGGQLAAPADADALVWTDPAAPEELAEVLIGSPARWVQLPLAGINDFIHAGLIDAGRTWTSAKGLFGPAVAEYTLAVMLAAARSIPEYVRRRQWSDPDEVPTRRMKGQRVLIVGTGGIGRSLVRLLEPLEPTILAVNRSGTPMPGASSTVTYTELRSLVGQVDWIVLAAPLTEQTHHLFDAEMLASTSGQAWLINVARGELIDTDALVSALAARRIGGAALDVTDPEPLPDGHPLWDFPNVIITPHIANTWDMALPELAARVERNVLAFTGGTPLEGVVDPALGY
jgi:phosphoglycerate dehydrogenase-like enzyme